MAKKPAIVPRKPSRDLERDKFVSGGVPETKRSDVQEAKRLDAQETNRLVSQETERSSAQATKPPAAQETKPSRARATKVEGEGRLVFVRADGREIKKVSIYFARDIAKRLAVYCAQVDRDMSDVVNELVAMHLPKEG
jgi:hypothetical protein